VDNPIQAIVIYAVFLFSLPLHEASHAWAAKMGGDPTAYLGGQVSLNPVPHMRREPFGMVLLPLIGLFLWGGLIGFASTPLDRRWLERHPGRGALVSLAGPASNLLLVITAGILIHVGIGMGGFETPFIRPRGFAQIVTPGSEAWNGAAVVLSAFFYLNVLLFLLNLLPVPPLDGSGVFPLLLGKQRTAQYYNLFSNPTMGLAGILIAWRLFYEIFPPAFSLALKLLYPGGYG
jgi:Zn-dependent protease